MGFGITDQLITARDLREKLGGISDMSLWRWQQSRGFPAPAIRIGGRRFWRLRDALEWLDRQSQGGAA